MRDIPFSAFPEETDARLAILLNLVHPGIGGLLLTGPPGSGKTTLARSSCSIHPDLPPEEALLTVPLGVTEENLLGSMDSELLLSTGEHRMRPGLLMRASGRILLLDDVNLFPDGITDLLLDAAASGSIGRKLEGPAQVRPQGVILLGTMNPQAGSLRPQLIDRFGLVAACSRPEGIEDRMRWLSTGLAWARDPESVLGSLASRDARIRDRVSAARQRVGHIRIPSWCLPSLAVATARLHLDGHRAEIVLIRAALAFAALEESHQITPQDLVRLAPLAFCHRTRNEGRDGPPSAEEARAAIESAITYARDSYKGATALHLDRMIQQALYAARQGLASVDSEEGWNKQIRSLKECRTLPHGGFPKHMQKRLLKELERFGRKAGEQGRQSGRQRGAPSTEVLRGKRTRVVPSPDVTGLDILPTIRSALLAGLRPPLLHLGREHWKRWEHTASTRVTSMLVVDASRSSSQYLYGLSHMLAVLFDSLFDPSSKVGLVVIQDGAARLVFAPTKNRLRVFGKMREISPGGYTPLADAIRLAARELEKLGSPHRFILLVSDGYPEPLPAGCREPWSSELYEEVRREGVRLGRISIPLLVIDPAAVSADVVEATPGRKLGRYIAHASGGLLVAVPAEELLRSGFYSAEVLAGETTAQDEKMLSRFLQLESFLKQFSSSSASGW